MTRRRYSVAATVTISVTCTVLADSPEEAKRLAEECPVGSVVDCLNASNAAHWGDHTDDVWLADELDGEPHMDDAEVICLDEDES